jgi:hypothetical protein
VNEARKPIDSVLRVGHVARGKRRMLVNTFFGRLFENDLFSSSIAASQSVMWMLAAIGTPGVMMSGSLMFAYAHQRALGQAVQDRSMMVNQAFHVDFAMAVAGLVTMLVWSSLTPDRRDALVLGHLPVTSREQAIARLLALLKFFGLFIVAVSIPAGTAFTFVTLGPQEVFWFPGRVMAHVGATVLGGGFVFFTLVNVQLFLAVAAGPRAVKLATWPLQAAAILGLILAIGSTERLALAMLRLGLDAGPWVSWNPAAWFAGVYRWLANDPRDVFAVLAGRGALAVLVNVALTLALYPFAYRRCLEHAAQGEGRRTGRVSRFWARAANAALSPMLRTPLERGLAAYMLATLSRSLTHRFLIGSYTGLGLIFALPLAGRLLQTPTSDSVVYAWFSVPLGLSFWTIAGMRVAIMLPVEPSANWIFKLTEPVDKRRALTTVVTVMAAVTCVPIAAGFGIAAGVMGTTVLGATVYVVVALMGLCLIEALTITLRTVPFTCTYLPGQLRLRVRWPIYFVVWLNMTFTLADWGVWALGSPRRTAQLAGALAALWLALRLWHLLHARRIRGFVYDEQPPPLVSTLDLVASMKQS